MVNGGVGIGNKELGIGEWENSNWGVNKAKQQSVIWGFIALVVSPLFY